MNNNENVSVTESQKKRLMAFFKTGRKITCLEALEELGIYRLSARISELKKIGVPINQERIQRINRFEQDVRIMRYWIEPYRKRAQLMVDLKHYYHGFFNKAKRKKIEQELEELNKSIEETFGKFNF